MTKEDKSFLLFIAGITVIFYGYIFRDMTALTTGIGIFAFNQWFAFYKKKRKKKCYLVNYGLNWPTLKMFWERINGRRSCCMYSEELSNKKIKNE